MGVLRVLGGGGDRREHERVRGRVGEARLEQLGERVAPSRGLVPRGAARYRAHRLLEAHQARVDRGALLGAVRARVRARATARATARAGARVRVRVG